MLGGEVARDGKNKVREFYDRKFGKGAEVRHLEKQGIRLDADIERAQKALAYLNDRLKTGDPSANASRWFRTVLKLGLLTVARKAVELELKALHLQRRASGEELSAYAAITNGHRMANEIELTTDPLLT